MLIVNVIVTRSGFGNFGGMSGDMGFYGFIRVAYAPSQSDPIYSLMISRYLPTYVATYLPTYLSRYLSSYLSVVFAAPPWIGAARSRVWEGKDGIYE